MKTFVDRGGTFTDVVTLSDSGELSLTKVPSDVAVIGELAVGELTLGTTVATNALLERTGVRTLLIVNEGFKDLPWVRDQTRPELFDPDAWRPPPLCAEVFEVAGRINADGEVIEELAFDLPRLRALLLKGAFEAVAVVLINSHRAEIHEEKVGQAVMDIAGEKLWLTLGHQASPELGYLARIETALVDAALSPLLRRAMVADRVPSEAMAIRSDGSLCGAHELRAPDAVLSGPAGGVLAVAAVAKQAGFERAVGLDMGGTSTDVCRVEVGRLPRREGDVEVAVCALDGPCWRLRPSQLGEAPSSQTTAQGSGSARARLAPILAHNATDGAAPQP